MRLKNKVAIVTGGAHGMGASEARLFAAIALVGDKQSEECSILRSSSKT
jgi:NAD(P)-dependent dehydrogenase (short-subunit alcohol dehydrogenase family)